MNKVKILIVEDELLVAEDIRIHLVNLGYQVTYLATSYNEAIDSIMSDLPDLVMVDININGEKDGIELGSFLRHEAEIPFIYLTANADKQTVNRAKETLPNAYLVKPFQTESLYASIEMALSNVNQGLMEPESSEPLSEELRIKDSLFLKKDNTYVKVKLDSIKYINADGNYIHIYVSKDENYMIRSTIKRIAEYLPEDLFFIPHKSYIINLSKLDEVSITEIMIDGVRIPLSKNRKDILFSMMNMFS